MKVLKLLLGISLLFNLLPQNLAAQLKLTPNQVGIFTNDPQFSVDVGGDLFVRSNLGGIMLGYPNNGNLWRMATINGGQDILYRFKPEGSSVFNTRMALFGNGDLAVGGDPGFSNARLEVLQNSTITDPQILLTEQQNDFARLSFENTTNPDTRWTLAGYAGSGPNLSKFNFWYQDTNGGTDIMTIQGDGTIGIMGTSPTARLHIHQGGQEVGKGLRFDDGTANQDWDITHGFGLRLHYGGALRGTFSAATGEYIQSSDGRLKKNVKKMPDVLSRVMELRPTSYQYKDTKAQKGTIGFIAQETAPLFPELVHYLEVDKLYGINYAGFSVVAIKAIQELKTELDQRDDRIAELENRLARIEKLLTEEETSENHVILEGPVSEIDRAMLQQNAPNPFESITTIRYRIPKKAQRAALQISDANGTLLRRMTIEQRGEIQTSVDAANLPAGTYHYTLWVDGEIIGTKKMVLSK